MINKEMSSGEFDRRWEVSNPQPDNRMDREIAESRLGEENRAMLLNTHAVAIVWVVVEDGVKSAIP